MTDCEKPLMYILPKVTVSPSSFRYIEIYEAVKQDIITGVLQEEDKLPSIRKFAEFLSVSTTPVELAYNQLIAEGFIESRPRRGFFVVKLSHTYGALNLNKETGEPGQHPAKEAGGIQSCVYDFHLSKNDFSYFPFRVWKRLHNQLFQPESKELLFYGNPQGEIGLRREIAKYLLQFRGVSCHPDRIIIGAEQYGLIHLAGLILKHHSDSVAVENPGYRLIPGALDSLGYQVIPIRLDEEGIDVDALRKSSAKIVSVSPSHQFPLGTLMPIARRIELLEWAKETDGFIIEDDYGGEFRYHGRPIPSLQGLLPNDNVIYLGGFSQVLAPDFCIHYMVLPERLVDSYHRLRRHIMFEASASRIHQRTLELFIRRGFFEQHVRKMRNVYRKKNNQLVSSIKEHFKERAEVIGESAGLHLVLGIKSEQPESVLIRMAVEAGIHISSAAFYWEKVPEGAQKRFIIGFGGIEIDRIDEGIRRLKEVWSPVLTD